MAENPHPSPFTIRKPIVVYEHSEPPPLVNSVRALITNLNIFSDFYQRADEEYNKTVGNDKPLMLGARDAPAEWLQRAFKALDGINRFCAYSLRTYGQELTIDTARKILGELIGKCGQKLEDAENLTLNEAMDLLEEERLSVKGDKNKRNGKATKPKPPTPKDALYAYIRNLKAEGMKPAGIVQHLENSPEAKDYGEALNAENQRKTRQGQRRNRTTQDIVDAALKDVYQPTKK